MPANESTRHKSSVALILIDVINDFEFPDGDKILTNALRIAGPLAKLKLRCRRAGIPAIYVNDNFGQWRSDANGLVTHCLDTNCAGQTVRRGAPPVRRTISCLSRCTRRSFRRPLKFCCDIWARHPDPDGPRHEQLHCLHGP